MLDKARLRAAAISQVLPEQSSPVIGVRQLREQIERTQQAMDDYNRLLALVDAAKVEFESEEARLNDLAVRLFAHVRACYGAHSAEYCAAGGKPPPARRKRRGRLSTPVPSETT